MLAIDKKVEEYRSNLLRIDKMKKALIDCEISLVSLKELLELNIYEWRKLIHGELEEKEEKVWELINKTPNHIKERNKVAKDFKKALIDKGLTINEVSTELKIDLNKLYRMINNISTNRDYEAEKKVNEFLGVKVFR